MFSFTTARKWLWEVTDTKSNNSALCRFPANTEFIVMQVDSSVTQLRGQKCYTRFSGVAVRLAATNSEAHLSHMSYGLKALSAKSSCKLVYPMEQSPHREADVSYLISKFHFYCGIAIFIAVFARARSGPYCERDRSSTHPHTLF
jgi:hypothetical protein